MKVVERPYEQQKENATPHHTIWSCIPSKDGTDIQISAGRIGLRLSVHKKTSTFSFKTARKHFQYVRPYFRQNAIAQTLQI